ncbi:filamentous hemagglutinin N-terminal domain-containing protein [uncultured Sphingomonas sp.]|uniref:two-partner secretion domain-containing protein n=1 Tax=uncultured Sphingomonas sp. TaxID=158754 RepID=UPI0025CC5066|nr:filamentous hemagglutinin N-terminal domain-containing protein [uncultured Sphingomonas sp.]
MTPAQTPSPTHAASPVRRLRLMLALSSALGTTTLGGLVAAPACGQSIPTPASVVQTQQSGVLGSILGAPDVSNPGGNLKVVLNARNTVIDWNGFNIPEDKSADFQKNSLIPGGAAVLNRDVSGNASQLLGKLTSGSDVAVWVYNPNGILVGSKASFNTGSLVLSTLDVNSSDFLSGGSSYRLTTGSGSTSAITVLNGAQIKVQGGNRGLVMVAPKIEADGNFQAVGQDVAFVTATDVKLSYSASSPLSVTINRGTPVSGRSQYVRGTVGGQDALFALASQSTVTDALLQIDAGVTTATTGERGIILSAGKPSNAVGGVTVSGAAADTGGVAGLLVNGGLTVNDGGSDIVAGSSGTMGLTGALSSQRDILLSTDGALTVSGAVTADRDYIGTGTGIALGTGAALVQSAGRTVRLTSSNGDLTGAAGLTLQSGGSAGVTLATTGTSAGNIQFDPTSSLIGGNDGKGYVDIRQRDAGNAVALGNVSARGLRQSIGTGSVSNGLTTTGALVLGNVDVRDGLALTSAGLTAGSLASDRGVTIASNGALATGAILSRGGAVTLTGSGATTIGGAVGADSDLTITRDGAITLAGLSSGNDIGIDAGSGAVAITGPVSAGLKYQVSGSGVTLGGTSPVTQAAKDAITITAGAGGITGASGLTLQSNSDNFGGGALTLALTAPSTTGIAFAPNTRLLGGPDRQSDVKISLADPASPIALGVVRAANLTGLSTTGTLQMGNVSVLGDLAAQGASIATGDVTSANGGVTLTAATGNVTAGAVSSAKSLTITAAQAVAVGGLSAQNAISVGSQGAASFGGDVTAGGPVTLSGASLAFTGGNVRSGGAIDLLASSGGITSTGALAVASTSGQSNDFIRLQANGTDGIAFASGSSITGGTNRALRVGIFNASADAPVRLGDVTARSLTALSAAGGDATPPGGAILSTGALAFGALNLVDSFAAESLNGNLSVGQIAVTGNGQGISLRATKGTLSVQNNLSTSGDVTLVSGAGLSLGTVESRNGRATLTSGGAITLGNLNGALGASASGTQLTMDSVRGGPVALTASAGGIQVGGISGTSVTVGATGGAVAIRNALTATGAVALTATGDVGVGGALSSAGLTVNAQGNAALLGGVQAQGDVAVAAKAVSLGGVHSATGAYAVTSTAGGITAANGTSILSDSNSQGGKALTLTATGDIAFDPSSSLGGGNGTSAVTLTTSGGAIGVGSVTASGFTATGASSIRTGDLTLGSGLSLAAAGGVTTGAINVGTGGVAIDAGSGALTTGAINAGDAVTLNGGTLAFGRVGAKTLKATATGTLTGGTIATQGDTTLQGRSITAGNVDAVNLSAVTGSDALNLGDLTLSGAAALSGGDVRFGKMTGTTLSATATGGLQGGAITSQGAVNATATGALALGTIYAGGATTLGGSSVNVGAVSATTLTATASSGNLTTGDIATSGAVGLSAAQGAVGLGQITTRTGDVTINSGGTLNAVGVTSGGAATLSAVGGNADVLLVNGLDAVGSASVSATGNVRAPQIVSRTGDLTIAAPNGELSGYTPGSGVTLGAGPGRAFSLTIGAAARLGDVVGGKLTIVATSISAGRVDTGSEALELRATQGDLTVRGPVTGGTVTLGASGRTSLNDVTATGGLSLTGGSIGFGNVAGATIDIASAGVVNGGRVTSSGTIGAKAAAIQLAALSGGGPVSAVATGGDLTLGGPVTGTDVTLGASGNASLGQVTASGALSINGGSVGFGDVAGTSVTVTSTGAVGGASVKATNAVAVTGASVGLGAVSGSTIGLTATGGDLNLTGPVNGTDVTLGASGNASLGQVTAGGALSIKGGSVGFGDVAGTTVTIASAGAVGGNSIKATGGVGVTGATVGLGSVTGGSVGLSATNGDLTLGGPVTGTDVTLGASGNAALGQVTAGGALSINGGSVGFGDVAGTSVTVASAGAVRGTSIKGANAVSVTGALVGLGTVSGGSVGLSATGGDLNLTGPVTGTDMTIGASGKLALTQASASGALKLTGGSMVFDSLAGASIDGQSVGAITGNAARATNGLSLRGASLGLGQASAGAGLALATTGGDLSLGSLTAGGDAVLNASGAASVTGNVTAGGGYRVTGSGVTLGGQDGIVQKAAGDVRITARAGDLKAARGLTLTSDADGTGAEALVLDAAGQIGFAGTRLQARPGGGAALGLRAGSGRSIELGQVEASRIGSFDGSAVATSLTHNASLTTGDLTMSDLSIALSGGDLSLGKVAATGSVALRTDAGAITLSDLSGGSVDLASGGALSTGAVTSNGAASLKGQRIAVGGRLAAARQLLAEARAALTLRDVAAGGAVTLKAGEALTAGSVEGASITAGGAGVTLTGAKAGDTLALTSSRDLTLNGGSAGGIATLDVAGLATIGGLTAGPSATITANDVALNGPLRAQTVAFVNRQPGTAALRIGDGTGSDGLRLSDAEVRQVSADTLRFDAGNGAMEVGALTLGSGSGRMVDMLGTGDVRVVGTVKTEGTGRTIRIGGGSDGGNAANIHVVATRDGGGRLLFDGSDVELRGSRIAMGLAPGFIDTLQPGNAGLIQAQSLISNGNSALYNAQLAGGFYDPSATTTLSARSLTVRFGDYALFQNTAVPGEFSGLKIGGTPGAPVSPALRISSFGTPGQNGVALFGTINGIGGASAALLGNPVIAIDPVLLPNSRINGCLAGSGAGCITTIVIQPTLQVFRWNSEEVFGIARDVAVPFSPVIGANNEELLSGLPELAPQAPQDQEDEK